MLSAVEERNHVWAGAVKDSVHHCVLELGQLHYLLLQGVDDSFGVVAHTVSPVALDSMACVEETY